MFVHLPPPPARSLQQSNDWHRTEAGEGESVRRGALIELINRRRHRIYRRMDGRGRTRTDAQMGGNAMGDKRSLPSHIASSRNLGLCHYLMEGRYSYSGNRCPRSKTLMRAERFSLFRYDQWWWNHFGPNVFAISVLNCDGKFSSLKNVEMGGRYAVASESGQEPLRNPERRDALKELSSQS